MIWIALPAYNESHRIGKLLEDIHRSLSREKVDYKIVVYDDGSSLVEVPTAVCSAVTTVSAVAGSLNWIANGLYTRNAAGAWTVKGDGGASGTGIRKTLEVPFTYSDSGTPVDSSTSIPSGARIYDVGVDVTTLFGGTPVLSVTVDGSVNQPTLLSSAAGDCDLATVNEYQKSGRVAIDSNSAGVVRVSLTGATTTGVGVVYVHYVDAPLG